ncbi:MAG: hypothetical protein JWM96_1335, partial [Alphaproteobacteria bacterium]|nr:hypothetical protein [Alphaproteobacteria bacterium]
RGFQKMSARNRAGRKSYETKLQRFETIRNFAQAMAEKKWKYDAATTKAMIIERTANGKTEVITFSQAYGELSMWLNVTFANISESGLSDMLAETFMQKAAIHTRKAVYRLWVKPAVDAAAVEKEEAGTSADRLRLAANQALAEKLIFDDEENGARWWNAFLKAEVEIKENKSIEFESGVLTLTSRGSGHIYIVTKDGCSTNCKAGSGVDYHKAIHAIFSKAVELETAHICHLCGESTETGSNHRDCELGIVPALGAEMERLKAAA